jgi:hypothetical protein
MKRKQSKKDEQVLQDKTNTVSANSSTNPVKPYALCILMGFILIIAIAVCILTNNVSKNNHKAAVTRLASITNAINQSDESAKITKEVVRSVDTDLDSDHWSKDDDFIFTWIKDAYTYNSLDEYNEHRAIYADRLGEDNQFVTDIMPYLEAEDITYKDEESYAGGNSRLFSSSISNFESSVLSVNDDAYTYLSILTTVNNFSDQSQSVSSNIILTYTISRSDSGDVQLDDFHAVKQYVKSK